MVNITVDDKVATPHAAKMAKPGHGALRVGREKDRLWHRISVRWQILLAFILINLIAGIVAAVVIVYNAQRAAEVEIASSMHLAESLVKHLVQQPQSAKSPDRFLGNLALQVATLRHVRILVTDARGSWTSLSAADEGTASDAHVPRWFSNLIRTDDIRREIRIGLDGHQIGSVVLVGNAADEIAEVWQDTLDLAAVAAILNLIVVAMLYLALGRVLFPLTNLAIGLGKLEQGDLQYRLPLPKVRELGGIANRFNSLADRLGAAKDDNTHLTRRLVTIQDDERRYIATELHDEMGPCLFGIKANVASLELIAAKLNPTVQRTMRERIATLGEITDKIQTLNRRLLTRIRPMALGDVPLAEVISGLVAEFERLNPNPKFSLTTGLFADGYGDTIDLTVYRCVQESITNVVRHAGAKRVKIELTELPALGSNGPDGVHLLRLAIRDDGRGIPDGVKYGFGLTGMEERVRALGGELLVTSQSHRGTRLSIEIPIQVAPGKTLRNQLTKGGRP